MSDTVNDGGQAFPWATGKGSYSQGMSLRDYHAAHCPITFSEFLRAWSKTDIASAEESIAAYATLRQRYADAMLKARRP